MTGLLLYTRNAYGKMYSTTATVKKMQACFGFANYKLAQIAV